MSSNKRKERMLEKLRAKIKERNSALADEFDYRLFYIFYFKSSAREPLCYEAEKVGLSMTNKYQDDLLNVSHVNDAEARELIAKDTVQIHAARWFPLASRSFGVVEEMNELVWPRTEFDRMEVFCFSRWKEDPRKPNNSPYKLLSLRFPIAQDEEISQGIVPYLVKSLRDYGNGKGGFVFNLAQNLGIWVDPFKDADQKLSMRLKSTILCFPQDELNRWLDYTGELTDNMTQERLLQFAVDSGRNITHIPPKSHPVLNHSIDDSG